MKNNVLVRSIKSIYHFFFTQDYIKNKKKDILIGNYF